MGERRVKECIQRVKEHWRIDSPGRNFNFAPLEHIGNPLAQIPVHDISKTVVATLPLQLLQLSYIVLHFS